MPNIQLGKRTGIVNDLMQGPKWLAIWALLFTTSVKAQTEGTQFFFDHFDPSKGFYASQAIAITKTSDSYLWIGTETGLVRYDGHDFYRNPIFYSAAEKLNGSYIYSLTADDSDQLWMDVNDRLCVFDYKNNTLHYPIFPDTTALYGPFKLHFNRHDHAVYIASVHGIYRQKKGTYVLEKLKLAKDNLGQIFDLCFDDNQRLWFVNGHDLYRFDWKTASLSCFQKPQQKASSPPNDYMSIFIERDEIWIGSWTKGLTRFNPSLNQWSSYTWADIRMFQNGILSITQTKDKQYDHLLWLATVDGIKTFDKNKRIFTSYYTRDDIDNKWIPGTGLGLFSAQDGLLWIGTMKGLHCFNPNKQKIIRKKLILPDQFNKMDLADLDFMSYQNKAMAILRYHYTDLLWYDLGNNKTVPLPSAVRKFAIPYDALYRSYLDPSQNLWLSSTKKGLAYFDFTNNKLVIPENGHEFKNRETIISITKGRNSLYYLHNTQKVFEYNMETNHMAPIDRLNSMLSSGQNDAAISNLMLDKTNTLWLLKSFYQGNKQQIIKYQVNSGNIKIYTINKAEETGKYGKIEDQIMLGDSILFILASNGFGTANVYDPELKITWRHKVNGQPIFGCRMAIAVSDHVVWINTNSSLFRYDYAKASITSFNQYNSNLKANPYYLLYFDPQKKYLLAAQHDEMYWINSTPNLASGKSNLGLTALQINGKPEFIQSGKKIDIEMNYGESDIELAFSNFNYKNIQDNKYEYRFADQNMPWVSMESNKLHFQELGHGNHTLLVRVANNDVHFNEMVLHLKVNPPFWKQWWFNLSLLVTITTFIFLLFRYREKERKRLEKLRFQIARDLHDDLGSHLSQVKHLSEIEALRQTNSTFDVITSKLAEIMESMSEIVWSINPSHDHFNDVILRIQEFAIQSLEPAGIHLKFSVQPLDADLKMNAEDKRNLYLIFKEGINNILKYANANHVYFSVKAQQSSVSIELKDDGNGFNPEMIYKGNGLKNMEARAQSMKADLKLTTSGAGTTIMLVLKVK